jgi:hypothetical protein
VKIMFLSANFWPLFWGIVGGGAVLTALLSLLAATARLPRRHHRPPLTVTEVTPRHHEETGKHLLTAGPK